MTTLTAWSFSKLSCWEKCPFQYKLKYIDRLSEPTPQAFERGCAVHKLVEDYAGGKLGSCPPELYRFADRFKELRRLPLKQLEGQWAFTKEWKETGWFSKDAWLRTVLDIYVAYPDGEADIRDVKTGKKYGDYLDQLELYALAAFCRYADISAVTVGLWFVDSGEEVCNQFTRADVEPLKAKWEARVGPMFADTQFLAKPNALCKWCHFRKTNGGPCAYG